MNLPHRSSGGFASSAIFKWLTVICGVLLLTTLAFLLPASLRYDRSTSWPTTPGVVSATGLKLYLEKSHIAPSFSPVVCYTYTANGIQRVGTRIDFSDTVLAFPQDQAMVWLGDHYPVGKTLTVYYNPSNPDTSVLVPGAKDLVFIALWASVVLAACCFGALAMYFRARRKQGRVSER